MQVPTVVPSPSILTPRSCCSRVKHRLLISSPRLRALLLRWTASSDPLAVDEMALLKSLVAESAPYLQPLFEAFKWAASPDLCRFVRALAKPSPLCGLILRPVETFPLLRDFSEGGDILSDVKRLACLSDNFPLLFELLSAHRNAAPVIAALRTACKQLAVSCIAFMSGRKTRVSLVVAAVDALCLLTSSSLCCCAEVDHSQLPPAMASVTAKQGIPLHDQFRARCAAFAYLRHVSLADEHNGHFFSPLLRDQRSLRTYAADATRLAAAASKSRKSVDRCFREPGKARILTPGVLTLLCEHGITHGFSVLREHESERHVFEMLLSRFPRGTWCLMSAWLCSSLIRAVCSSECGVLRSLLPAA